MIQVRCPECGYLQSLSEERFVAIADDHLDCPHCNAKVPKTWNSVQEETAPEETLHKIHAFARRILNGGAVRREVVYALESLVRHHGGTEESTKALGVGYTELGEYKKAEEFLKTALEEIPNDVELLRALFRVRMEEGPVEDAVAVGRALLDAAGRQVEDDDVAGLAVVFERLGRTEDAEGLLARFPDLDSRNPLVKKARRGIGGRGAWGLPFRLSELIPWMGLLKRKSVESDSSPVKPRSEDATRRVLNSAPEEPASTGGGGAENEADYRQVQVERGFHPVLDYWIYAPESEMPEWDRIKSSMVGLHSESTDRERAFEELERFVERKELTMDYILRRDAEETFHYPEELLPRNSRNLQPEDREILTNAQMIIRLRLIPGESDSLDYLAFMLRFVEAVRLTTGGVVQDAISHTLWGIEEWKKHATGDPLEKMMEAHVHLDVLDEGGTVWIHSHGMQKFGLPEIEMDGVPTEMAFLGRAMLVTVGERLVNLRDEELDIDDAQALPETPFRFRMRFLPPDEENHFPTGSLKVFPYVSDYDPESPDTMRHVLKMLDQRSGGHLRFGRRSRSNQDSGSPKPDAQPTDHTFELRTALIEAHNTARESLGEFKRRFQQKPESDAAIYAVKIGFPVKAGEYEWMWVTLDAWRGTSLVGQLENSPVLRKDLQKGSRVEIQEGEIFDWVISREGAVVNGAFTESVQISDQNNNAQESVG